MGTGVLEKRVEISRKVQQPLGLVVVLGQPDAIQKNRRLDGTVYSIDLHRADDGHVVVDPAPESDHHVVNLHSPAMDPVLFPVRYERRGFLGDGRSGEVWAAYGRYMDREVALKLIRDPSDAVDPALGLQPRHGDG